MADPLHCCDDRRLAGTVETALHLITAPSKPPGQNQNIDRAKGTSLGETSVPHRGSYGRRRVSPPCGVTLLLIIRMRLVSSRRAEESKR